MSSGASDNIENTSYPWKSIPVKTKQKANLKERENFQNSLSQHKNFFFFYSTSPSELSAQGMAVNLCG